MTRLTRLSLLLFAVVVLLIGGMVVFLATLDEQRLVALLVQRVEALSDTRISHSGGIDLQRGLSPALTIRDLHVEAEDASFAARTSALSVQVNLLKILVGRLDIPSLSIGDTHIDIRGEKPAPAPEGAPWFQAPVDLSALRLKPTVHQVTVASLDITLDDASWRLPAGHVTRLSLQLQTDADIPVLSADFNVVGEVMHIDARLPEFQRALKSGRLPFSVNVSGPLANIAVEGAMDFTRAEAAVEARLQLDAGDLGRYRTAAEGLSIPGALTLEAQVKGALNAPVAERVDAEWRGPGESRLTLTGRIGDLAGFEQLDLKLAGALNETGWLRDALPASLPLSRAAVDAAIRGSGKRIEVSGLDLKAHTTESLAMQLQGGVQLADSGAGGYAPENIVASFSFEAPTTRAARFILFDDVPEFGAIRATADVRSTQGHPRIENIDLRTASDSGIEAVLAGRIDAFPLDPSPNRGYGLDVTITGERADAVTRAVGLDLPLAGPLRLSFDIAGDTPALELNAIALQAGSDKAMHVDAKGYMHFGDWSRDDPLKSLDLEVQAYSHSLEAFAHFAHDATLPALAPFKLSGRIRTEAGHHRVEGVRMRPLKSAAVQWSLTGGAASLVLFPQPALTGIALDVSVSGSDTAALNDFFHMDKRLIPAAGAFEASSRVTGTSRSITIAQTRIAAGSKGVVQLTADGSLGRLDAGADPAAGWAFYDSDLDIRVAADSSKALLKSMGYDIPPLGPLQGQAAIVGNKQRSFALDRLRLAVGDDAADPVVSAQGAIGDLYNWQGFDIDVALNIDGENLAAFADRRALEELAPVTGTLTISDKPGTLGIQTLAVNSNHENLAVDIQGSFTDFSNSETLALRARVNARDLAMVGALFDREWPAYAPFELSSDIGRDGRRMYMQATLRAGEKGLDAQLHGDHSKEIPDYAGKLTLHQLSLPDFYVKAAENRRQRKQDRAKQQRPLFPREPLDLDILRRFNLALVIDVDSFDRSDSEAESADVTVKLKDGVLRVSPAVVKYPKGQLDINFDLDVRAEPKFVYKAAGTNLNPWLGLSGGHQDGKEPVDADVDIAVHLAGQGGSPHALAASLDGDIYMTITDGKLSRSFSDLLFIDIVGWTASLVKDQRYTDLNCGLLDLRIDAGLVSTEAFFIDTNSITVTGEGTVDLGKEQVDYVFVPRKKSRLILNAEPVKVTGSLADPDVKAVPVKSAALTFGTLIFAPYVFVGMQATDLLTANKDHDKGMTPCLSYERSNGGHNKKTALPVSEEEE